MSKICTISGQKNLSSLSDSVVAPEHGRPSYRKTVIPSSWNFWCRCPPRPDNGIKHILFILNEVATNRAHRRKPIFEIIIWPASHKTAQSIPSNPWPLPLSPNNWTHGLNGNSCPTRCGIPSVWKTHDRHIMRRSSHQPTITSRDWLS